MSSSSESEFIYVSGSIRGLRGRGMEKPLVNLSSWHMMLTTLKKKSLMKKNFGTYPKETAADQSRVRRLSPVDSRYVFSISVSLAAQEMNKSAAFLSTESLRANLGLTASSSASVGKKLNKDLPSCWGETVKIKYKIKVWGSTTTTKNNNKKKKGSTTFTVTSVQRFSKCAKEPTSKQTLIW